MDPKNYCQGPAVPPSTIIGGDMAPKNKAQLPSGNYINIVPVGVPYHHRRKFSPQITPDYQSRLYFGDYMRDRCREEFFPITTTPIPPTDLDHHIVNSNVIAASGASATTATQQSQQQQQQQQQQQPLPSVLYTVQRVVTTTQIQAIPPTTTTATTANYGSNNNASVSSNLQNIVRNEPDCGKQNVSGSGGASTNSYQLDTGSDIEHSTQQSNISSNTNNLNNNNNNNNHHHHHHHSNSLSSGSCSSGPNNNQFNSNSQHHYNTSSIGNHHSYGSGPSSTSVGTSTTNCGNGSTIPRPLQKVIPTVVYLMSRIAVHMEIEGTAQCPAQVMLAAALGCEELGITNKLLAQSIFGLWMTSPQLEVQLKAHHRPYAVRVAWDKLLEKYSHGNELDKLADEPMTALRRNVFYAKREEEKIKDSRIVELLYEEARQNVLLGRYIMEPVHAIMLGGIQARIELGPYNAVTHEISYFRENQLRFLPAHVAKNTSWSWLPISRQSSAEFKLLEQFKRVPTTATTRKLMKKYLEFCWALPFYGAAFFHGQVEQPVRGLMSLVQQKDIPVLIAINEKGIFLIDQIECTLLLGLRYEELSWDYAKPSIADDPDCLPCIFVQFNAIENGIAVTKLMQIFSRQSAMMDALISHFTEQMKRRKDSIDASVAAAGANGAGAVIDPSIDIELNEPNPIQNNGNGVLSNKLSRLTLATFDDEGRCIGQMGSLSISY